MKPKQRNLSTDRLRELLSYDPNTGLWVWISKNKFSHVKVGSIAGYLHRAMYWIIKVDGEMHYSHRLAWQYMTGEIPQNLVDHADTDTQNNKWDNLREATYRQNCANSRPYRTNLPKGVYVNRSQANPFVAIIKVNYRNIHLGVFSTLEEAQAAYKNSAILYNGEFARTV